MSVLTCSYFLFVCSLLQAKTSKLTKFQQNAGHGLHSQGSLPPSTPGTATEGKTPCRALPSMVIKAKGQIQRFASQPSPRGSTRPSAWYRAWTDSWMSPSAPRWRIPVGTNHGVEVRGRACLHRLSLSECFNLGSHGHRASFAQSAGDTD